MLVSLLLTTICSHLPASTVPPCPPPLLLPIILAPRLAEDTMRSAPFSIIFFLQSSPSCLALLPYVFLPTLTAGVSLSFGQTSRPLCAAPPL